MANHVVLFGKEDRIGLVNQVVEQGQALDTAKEMAVTLCANSPVAVRLELEYCSARKMRVSIRALALE
jgi:enoyl-CoA hydratase/carnithine racemase